MGILVNSASGNTIRELKNPIRWLFNHSQDVVSFEVKALDHGEGLLTVYMHINQPVMLKMTWISYRIMLQQMVYSRAWRNHFAAYKIHKYNSSIVYQINN